jgi:hypothetical protein
MRKDVELVPGLVPGKYMKIRAGAAVYSLKKGHYTLVRAQVVRLAYYRSGLYVTADMAFNDRDYRVVLEERGFDFEQLIALRETDRNAFYKDMRVEIHKPKAVWAGSGSYWVETDIDNVSVA